MVQVWQAFSNDVRCGCGELPRDCPFWTAVIEQAFGGWGNLDVAGLWAMQRRVDRNRNIPLLLFPRLTRRLAPSFAREMRSYVDDLIRLYAAIQQVSGASVLVDSGKYTSYAYLLKQLAGKGAFRLFVIHLVRDPRGVAYSWTKLTKKSEHADAKNMGQHPPAKTALRWVANNLLFELLARTSARTQRLRYEDFVEAPEGTVRALLDRAQIPAVDTSSVFPDPHTVDLTLANHTVAGNPMRFRTGRIEVRGDDQWRDKMPARQRRVVSLITAPLRWLYGYRD
jgi:hypothetical protein